MKTNDTTIEDPFKLILIEKEMDIHNIQQNHSIIHYFGILILAAFPTIIYLFGIYAVFSINIHFAGQLNNPNMLDAVGMSITWLNCTTFAVIISLNTGFVARASQAFGAGNFKLIGIYFHRALIANLLILVGCFLILAFSKWAFILFGLPEQTIQYATEFIFISYGACFSLVVFDTLKNYLIAQGFFIPHVIIQIVLSIAHWFWCEYLAITMELGINGIAIAFTITETTGALILLLFISIYKPCPESWFWFNKDSFKKIWNLLKFEIQLGSMVYLEWIAFEITVIFASSYNAVEFGGLLVFLTVLGIFVTVPQGTSFILTSFVANAIGEKDEKKAKMFLKSGLYLIFIFLVISWCCLKFFSQSIGSFFSSDAGIIGALQSICDVYLVILPIDFIQTLLGGYVRGIGKEKIGSIVFIFSYYVIGLPIAFIIGNVFGDDDQGLWIGLACGIFTLFCSFSYIIFKTNVADKIREMSLQLESDEKQLSFQSNRSSIPDDDSDNQYIAPHFDSNVSIN